MTTEKEVQKFVHTLEEGVWVRWIKRSMAVVALATLAFIVLTKTHGLSVPEGMDQAQIAREIARGNGFSTKTIRPLALWQFQDGMGSYPRGNIPDTFHAPLNPFINSFALRLVRSSWQMTPKMIVNPCDQTIGEVAIFFFFLALAVNYFTAKRLFDASLAATGTGLAAVCNTFWQYALSGLPQMLMLFLFSAALYTLVRALEARDAGGRVAGWAAATGALFGLLALAHGLTIWIFGAVFLYAIFAFRPFGRHALLMLAVFSVFYTPWLIRNYEVCGDPRGLGVYAVLDGAVHSGSEWMRCLKPVRSALENGQPTLDEVGPAVFFAKLESQALSQLNRIYGLFGASIAAPLFFVSLLHAFKRPAVASFRWGFLAMGLGAFLGMGIFGFRDESALQPNDLYILFVPMMVCYGLAFFLALWARMEIPFEWMRVSLVSIIYIVSGFPLLHGLFERQGAFNWPPYLPPVISVFNLWTDPGEIMMSDMPWAVAWYADRKCLWLPGTQADFLDLTDYNRLGAPIVGLYLTPVSGNARLRADIVDGEYRDWRSFILGVASPKGFPLQWRQVLPVNNECIFIADKPRWLRRRPGN